MSRDLQLRINREAKLSRKLKSIDKECSNLKNLKRVFSFFQKKVRRSKKDSLFWKNHCDWCKKERVQNLAKINQFQSSIDERNLLVQDAEIFVTLAESDIVKFSNSVIKLQEEITDLRDRQSLCRRLSRGYADIMTFKQRMFGLYRGPKTFFGSYIHEQVKMEDSVYKTLKLSEDEISLIQNLETFQTLVANTRIQKENLLRQIRDLEALIDTDFDKIADLAETLSDLKRESGVSESRFGQACLNALKWQNESERLMPYISRSMGRVSSHQKSVQLLKSG